MDWNAVVKYYHSFPQQFQLWITKHVSGCNASNKLQVHLGRAYNNLCPICESAVESSSHHVLCGDADRTRIYHEDVDAIFAWMRETKSDPVFAAEFYEYLNGRSSRCFGGELEDQWGELDDTAR